jgi:hypothetical protein
MKGTTTTASNSISNNYNKNKNKEYLMLREIAPQWSETLSKILNGNNKDIVNRLYSKINDYKKCIVGEAYGYDHSYVMQGTKKTCQECTTISGTFSYAIRRHNNIKPQQIIDKFTNHWNENHVDITST